MVFGHHSLEDLERPAAESCMPNFELTDQYIYWEARRFCGQFKKLVSFAFEKRTGSGPREFEFPSTNECKLFFAEKYSLSSEVFEIN